ncbi:hypothetical protein FSP39_020056 [Pinctada imbricata]|uniref:Reverse transcriptase domain-containing protein n=1 Tax=Pinctada imbricata TaxID=66713 RepID=A0AA89BJN4_PINIB|nr:hypothetical protein FSP39_020056 [Pinctada imbricata]
MTSFRGTFNGVCYDHCYPPSRHFKNASNCEKFKDFINTELVSRLRSGAISYWGPIDKVTPPHIVSPITIEPSKPRLCINLRYLNCFMKDTPFTLDTLSDVPKIIGKNVYMSKLDDKSGYDNVCVTDSSKTLLGFQWAGHYFTCNTLPFGWKNSAYVYHSLNLQAISYMREMGISCLLYIDDRLIEHFHGYMPPQFDNSYTRAKIALRFAVYLFTSLGYFLNIGKSVLDPCQCITFLGLIVDSVQQSFFVPNTRKDKFSNLRKSILSSSEVSVNTIQKFVGMCISFSNAIPGSKLYTSACNRAISRAIKDSSNVPIVSQVREEIAHWIFIDSWNTPFPWIDERHHILSLYTDSSNYKWGAVMYDSEMPQSFSDFWTTDELNFSIMIKEALALKSALMSLGSQIQNKRIIAHVDNKAVVYSWNNQYSRNDELNKILKDIFMITYAENCSLTIDYIPTTHNLSDAPSRSLSKSDATISRRTWLYNIQYVFGSHTVDMFALDSNVMRDIQGNMLKHFTPFPTPHSSGVDAFAQIYSVDENYYAFPPFCLLPSVIRFVIHEQINCTLLLPEVRPLPPWFTVLMTHAVRITPVGFEGDKGVLLFPSRNGYRADKVGLQWNLLAVRFSSTGTQSKQRNLLSENIFFRQPTVFTPVLLISDSMLRFLTDEFVHVKVVSVGGARLLDTLALLNSHIEQYNVFLVILHSGTNDINKMSKPEQTQMILAQRNLERVVSSVHALQKCHEFAVVFSGCICTQSTIINQRVKRFNEWIISHCIEYQFSYVDHSNITCSDLRDFVHLNAAGETLVRKNFSTLI